MGQGAERSVEHSGLARDGVSLKRVDARKLKKGDSSLRKDEKMQEDAAAHFNPVPPQDFLRGFRIESQSFVKNSDDDDEADEDSMNVE